MSNRTKGAQKKLKNLLSTVPPKKIIRPRVWPGTGFLAETAATRQEIYHSSPCLLSSGHTCARLLVAETHPAVPTLSSPHHPQGDHKLAVWLKTSSLGYGKTVMKKSKLLQRDQQKAHALWGCITCACNYSSKQAKYIQPSSRVAPRYQLVRLASAAVSL